MDSELDTTAILPHAFMFLGNLFAFFKVSVAHDHGFRYWGIDQTVLCVFFIFQLNSEGVYPQRPPGPAVVTRVVPSAAGSAFIVIARRVQHFHWSSICINFCTDHDNEITNIT